MNHTILPTVVPYLTRRGCGAPRIAKSTINCAKIPSCTVDGKWGGEHNDAAWHFLLKTSPPMTVSSCNNLEDGFRMVNHRSSCTWMAERECEISHTGQSVRSHLETTKARGPNFEIYGKELSGICLSYGRNYELELFYCRYVIFENYYMNVELSNKKLSYHPF